jgi:succinyl-CoA synthetase beta subunit
MNLHEYQSKQLFAQYAIPTPEGKVEGSPDGAVAAAQKLGGSLWVAKAQVHAGRRGKAGGVRVARIWTRCAPPPRRCSAARRPK